jgi:hypothetical protein
MYVRGDNRRLCAIGDQCRLAAWRRTHIKYFVARLRINHLAHELRCLILDVNQTFGGEACDQLSRARCPPGAFSNFR